MNVISSLNRKMLRDLVGIKGQALAICVVMAAGVTTFVMSLSTLESLRNSRDSYYDRYRFAHVFANLKRAPNSLAERMAEIPGVSQVQTRIVMDVTLDVAGMKEPAIGRLISVPKRPTPGLNDLHIRSGRYIDPGRASEALVSEAFAAAHNFAVGDYVLAIINGRRQRLDIVGIALSPEYLIQIQGGNLLPDDKRFGVFWMGYEHLAAAFDMDGAFNDVTLSLMRGAMEKEVIKRVDNLTETYGGVGAFGRDEQVSARYIADEIRQLSSMGIVAPVIFLFVAAFLLNTVLSRLISIQREQIAALKAFGYTRREVGFHYLKLVLVIVLLAVTLGTVAGAWLGQNLTKLYSQFYRLPVFDYDCGLRIVVLALLVAGSAAVLGTTMAVRRAMHLQPAEAMRPETPKEFRPTIVERCGLGNLFSHAAKMVLRQLERRPGKSLFSCLGISMAVAVLVLGTFTEDALQYLIDYEFNQTQRQDVMLTFVEPTSSRSLHEVRHLPGVLQCEPFRSVPTRVRFGHRSRRVAIMGLAPHSQLFRLLDDQGQEAGLPSDGVLLSSKLAELLRVKTGDDVTVEVLEGERPIREVFVAGTITEFGGTNAYMSVGAVHRLLREGESLSGAMLDVDTRVLDELYTTLKRTPKVASVVVKAAAVESFRKTFTENLMRMRVYNICFASIIAIGVVYNAARISLSERSREFGTLRVIGFSRAEISAILLGELAVLTLAAIPLGLFLGYGFCWIVSLGLDTELYRIPLIVAHSTYAFAVTVTLIAALISGLIVRRRLDHMDLVAVLKSKE